jgi:hypothetical protein
MRSEHKGSSPALAFGLCFAAWFGRAWVAAVPSAFFAASLELSRWQWLVVGFTIACYAALFAWLTLRFGVGQSRLARVVRALPLAVWIRAAWCVVGLAIPVSSLLAAPLLGDLTAGAGLVSVVEELTTEPIEVDPDANADRPDPEDDYPEHDLLGLHLQSKLGQWTWRVWLVTLLQGVVVAVQLALIACVVAGFKALRARRAQHAA